MRESEEVPHRRSRVRKYANNQLFYSHAASVPHTPSVPADPTPYIRTYAKDVARLTGTQASHVGPVKEAPTPGVKFADVDMSQTQGGRKDPASPKEFPQEVISVTKEDTIQNLNAPAPAAPEAHRDEILERLRARIQSKPAEPVSATAIPTLATPTPIVAPTPSPLPPAPPPALKPVPVPPPAAPQPFTPPPVSAPAPEPPPAPVARPQAFAPMHPSAAPVAAPHAPFSLFGHHEQKPAAPKPAEANLHTFKSDFSDHLNDQKASTFAVLAAQSDVRETRANAPKPAVIKSKKSRLPFILSAIALVVIGIGLIGGAYWFVALRFPSAATPFAVPSLIFADEKVELPAADSPLQSLQKLAQEPSVNGNVIVTYTTTTTNGKKGIIKTAQPSGPIIKQMFAGAPDILIRNINDPSTVGVLSAGGINAPFFVLQVSSYERTFAGMLGWEPTMASTLATLYPSAPAAAVSSSSAPQIVSVPRFIDSTVANHDVRVLKDSSNQTILIYGYRDKETLIIAKNEAAFTALLVRLSAANKK